MDGTCLDSGPIDTRYLPGRFQDRGVWRTSRKVFRTRSCCQQKP